MYEPLSGDIERQREALTGLAVAEGICQALFLVSIRRSYTELDQLLDCCNFPLMPWINMRD
jgi:hypothetical protein